MAANRKEMAAKVNIGRIAAAQRLTEVARLKAPSDLLLRQSSFDLLSTLSVVEPSLDDGVVCSLDNRAQFFWPEVTERYLHIEPSCQLNWI